MTGTGAVRHNPRSSLRTLNKATTATLHQIIPETLSKATSALRLPVPYNVSYILHLLAPAVDRPHFRQYRSSTIEPRIQTEP